MLLVDIGAPEFASSASTMALNYPMTTRFLLLLIIFMKPIFAAAVQLNNLALFVLNTTFFSTCLQTNN